jgi:hypothetical protein
LAGVGAYPCSLQQSQGSPLSAGTARLLWSLRPRVWAASGSPWSAPGRRTGDGRKNSNRWCPAPRARWRGVSSGAAFACGASAGCSRGSTQGLRCSENENMLSVGGDRRRPLGRARRRVGPLGADDPDQASGQAPTPQFARVDLLFAYNRDSRSTTSVPIPGVCPGPSSSCSSTTCASYS